ncbi:MAG: hypothetical protein AAF411_14905 [Myxococcota bacterium]
MVLALACSNETPSSLNDDPGLVTAIAAGKADGAFGSRAISLGQTVEGNAGRDALALYSLEVATGDAFTVEVRRTSGDLRPSAYLYDGGSPNRFVRPETFETAADRVTLNYTVEAVSGTFFIAVRAYEGEGTGDFEMRTTCTGGPCMGAVLSDLAQADQCILRATDCALTELPRFNGAVGAGRAGTLLTECLAAEGPACTSACDASEAAREACDLVLGLLPDYADRSRGCAVTLTSCIDTCTEVSPFGLGEDEDAFHARACLAGYGGSDFYGNCLDYADGHADCGGTEYAAGSTSACEALCGATDGAWDEGPWDGCTSLCETEALNCDIIDDTVADCVFDGFDEASCFDDVARDPLAQACCDAGSWAWCDAVDAVRDGSGDGDAPGCDIIDDTVADCLFDGFDEASCFDDVARDPLARTCCDAGGWDWCDAVDAARDSDPPSDGDDDTDAPGCDIIDDTVADCLFDGFDEATCFDDVARDPLARTCCDAGSWDWCDAVDAARDE